MSSGIFKFQSRIKHNSSTRAKSPRKMPSSKYTGYACERSDPRSREDTADESSDLTELDTEDGEFSRRRRSLGRQRKRKMAMRRRKMRSRE